MIWISFSKQGTEAIKGLILNLQTVMEEQQHMISCMNHAKREYHEDLISKSRQKRYRLGFFSWQPVENGLTASFSMSNEVVFETKIFAKMHKLKLLQLNYVKLNGSYKDFPKSLIWLCWHGFPLKFLPSNLHLEKLVVLDMRYSSLKYVWKGIRVWFHSLSLSLCFSLSDLHINWLRSSWTGSWTVENPQSEPLPWSCLHPRLLRATKSWRIEIERLHKFGWGWWIYWGPQETCFLKLERLQKA